MQRPSLLMLVIGFSVYGCHQKTAEGPLDDSLRATSRSSPSPVDKPKPLDIADPVALFRGCLASLDEQSELLLSCGDSRAGFVLVPSSSTEEALEELLMIPRTKSTITQEQHIKLPPTGKRDIVVLKGTTHDTAPSRSKDVIWYGLSAPGWLLTARIGICSTFPTSDQQRCLGLLSYFFGEDFDSGTVPAKGPTAHRAYDLTLLAFSCWYAAAWDGYEDLGWVSDTLGDDRCTELAQRVYGSRVPDVVPDVIDASPAAVGAIASLVETLARVEHLVEPATHASELATLVRAMGAARNEELIARLIGSAQMLTKKSQHLQLGDIPQSMQNHPALETLLHLDAGEFSADARTLGLLAALNLTLVPKGNRGYSDIYQMALLRNVLGTVFGPVPAVSPVASDSTTQADEAWLAYRVKVAGQAGHTPSALGTFDRRSAVAWRGILLGFADKLHAQSKQLSPAGRTILLPLIERIQARLKWANIDELEVR